MYLTGAKGGKILVYEYVPNGSLLEYIMGKFELVLLSVTCNVLFTFLKKYYCIGRKGRSLNWRQRVILAIGAAKGKVFRIISSQQEVFKLIVKLCRYSSFA